MSIIPPIEPSENPLPAHDEIGRKQEVCANCGDRIVMSRWGPSDGWCHPDKGYATYCETPLRARPL